MAETWTIVVTYLIVIIAASFEGVNHAILWSGRRTKAFKWNEHILFVLQRGVFFGAVVFAGIPWALIPAALAYPFFHNGFYYWFRNRIDQSYPQGFIDDSTDSSATVNFSFSLRATLFVVSVLWLFVLIIK